VEVVTVDTYFDGRHYTEYHWYEAVPHPMKASFGPHPLGSERKMSFAIYKRWSYTDPRKTQRLRGSAQQPPTGLIRRFAKWLSRHFV
jgi:hypothetical protein